MSRTLNKLGRDEPQAYEIAMEKLRREARTLRSQLTEGKDSPTALLWLIGEISRGSDMGNPFDSKIDASLQRVYQIFPGDIFFTEIRMGLIHELTKNFRG